MFRADAALQIVSTLSGGQLLRAGLACVLGGTKPPPLLILDEPTNHLDIDSIEAVEAASAPTTARCWSATTRRSRSHWHWNVPLLWLLTPGAAVDALILFEMSRPVIESARGRGARPRRYVVQAALSHRFGRRPAGLLRGCH